ncbi:hypothetical protein ACE6H2_006928 [Prunus campanulata]
MSINYNNNTIRVVDPGFKKNNCTSIPLYSLSSDSINARSPYNVYDYEYSSMDRIWISRAVTFIKCANPVNSSLYVDTALCMNSTTGGATSLSQPRTYSYVVMGPTVAWDLEEGCSIGWTAMASLNEKDRNASYSHIHNALVYGFELQYITGIHVDPYRYTRLSRK